MIQRQNRKQTDLGDFKINIDMNINPFFLENTCLKKTLFLLLFMVEILYVFEISVKFGYN